MKILSINPNKNIPIKTVIEILDDAINLHMNEIVKLKYGKPPITPHNFC